MNYAHKLSLVLAEAARVAGDVPEAMSLYDRAIDGAREQGYLQDEALAAELAGNFYHGLGHARIAETYHGAAFQATRPGARRRKSRPCRIATLFCDPAPGARARPSAGRAPSSTA